MEESDFLTKFYNLEGDSISERKKNFFKLLRSQQTPLSVNDLTNLRPRTYLETLFQMDIFIYFKIVTKVVDLMRSGNKSFIKKIFKNPNILKEIIENIPAEKFVKEFLPSISYSTRMKILHKIYLIMNTSQMDEIFFWLEKEYGLNIAVKVLHTCSSAKIKEFLCNYEVILSSRQVKFIFDKDPELFVYYLNLCKMLTASTYLHRNLSIYVALKNPKMWLRLQEENAISCDTLGYKTSRRIIRFNKKEFLSRVKYYSHFVRMDVIVQELDENFEEVYSDFFPKDKNNINTNNFCHKLLSYYPKRKRWNVFEQTFKKVFKSNVLDNLIYLNYSFVKLFENRSVMNVWAKVHYLKEGSNYILKYCDTKTAIPLITQKIDVTLNTQEKFELVGLLLETCAENEDLVALEGVVLPFICLKYLDKDIIANDWYDIVCHILHKIVILFKLEQFNENHWTHFNKILSFTRETDKTDFYYFTDIFICDLKYLEYLCLHGKSFQNELITFIKEIDANKTWFYIELENPEIEKTIWTETIKTYSEIMEIDEKTTNNFINSIIDFNEEHPDHCIDISDFPQLFNHLLSIFEGDTKSLEHGRKKILERVINYNYKFPDRPIIVVEDDRILKIFLDDNKYFARHNALEEMVTKKNRSKFENGVLTMLWENIVECRYLNKRIITWFLINEPSAIVPYFDQILESNKTFIDISYVKLLSHLNFDTIIIDYCVNKLESIDGFLKRIARKRAGSIGSQDFIDRFEKQREFNTYVEIIRILSELLTTNEYIAMFKRFLPLEDEQKTMEESLNIYFLLCEVVKCMKNLDEPTTALPTVIQFCFGDYLRPALCTLYSVCYRTPENILYSYIDKLCKSDRDCPRKHGTHLTCELLNYNYVLNELRRCNDLTICTMYVFKSTLRYFRKNPSEELLSVISTTLNTPYKIGDYKQIMYVQESWRFFEKLRRKAVPVHNYLIFILDIIITSKDILVSLPVDFCREIITNYYQIPLKGNHCIPKIHSFVCLFLRNEKSEQSYNFKFVFNIIADFEKNKHTEAIKIFFYSFYDMAVEDIHNNKKIDHDNNYHIELFKEHWFHIFNYSKMFDECVLLNLLYFKCDSSDEFIENYARDVTDYLKKLSDEFGPHIYEQVQNILLYKNTFSEKEKLLFYYKMLLNEKCSLNYILVLNLLEQSTCNDETKEIYLEIIDMLKHSNDPDVHSRLKSYIEKQQV